LKIFNLTKDSSIYTANAYLVLGTWNAIQDVNTLVDVGRDPLIIDAVKAINTGLGKPKVNQVILTHSHYDHTSMLPEIKKHFKPSVYAFSRFLSGVDYQVKDNQKISIADETFEIIYSPGHSHDSICLYCEAEGILFSGDTPVIIYTQDGTYEPTFIAAMEKISQRDIQIIYPGHGNPIDRNCNDLIHQTLLNVRKNEYDHNRC